VDNQPYNGLFGNQIFRIFDNINDNIVQKDRFTAYGCILPLITNGKKAGLPIKLLGINSI
jgi:hypothetical protein